MTISSRPRNNACLSTMELLIPLVFCLRIPPGNTLAHELAHFPFGRLSLSVFIELFALKVCDRNERANPAD